MVFRLLSSYVVSTRFVLVFHCLTWQYFGLERYAPLSLLDSFDCTLQIFLRHAKHVLKKNRSLRHTLYYCIISKFRKLQSQQPHNKVYSFAKKKNKCYDLCGIQCFSFNCPCRQSILIHLEKEIGTSAFIFLNHETFGGRNQL